MSKAVVMLNQLEDALNDCVSDLMQVGKRVASLRLFLEAGGNEPSPVKPRTRRQFNEDMQRLHDDLPSMVDHYLKDQHVDRPTGVRVPRSIPKEMLYFSLDELLNQLLSENSSPATAASGPRKARRATRARKVTSSKSTKRARSGKGGK